MQGHIRGDRGGFIPASDPCGMICRIISLISRASPGGPGIDVEEKGSELAGYFAGIGTSLDALNYSIHTGASRNRCGAQRKGRPGKRAGIRFNSEFRFPADYGIDAFDPRHYPE